MQTPPPRRMTSARCALAARVRKQGALARALFRLPPRSTFMWRSARLQVCFWYRIVLCGGRIGRSSLALRHDSALVFRGALVSFLTRPCVRRDPMLAFMCLSVVTRITDTCLLVDASLSLSLSLSLSFHFLALAFFFLARTTTHRHHHSPSFTLAAQPSQRAAVQQPLRSPRRRCCSPRLRRLRRE